MLLVAIAWLYVVLMVALVEATSSNGTLLGALFTLLVYGLVPVGLIGYLFFSPARRRVRRAAEFEVEQDSAGVAPDESGHSPRDAVAAERKEP